ncbi:hypothetical protein IJD34_03650 [bacterium]|nr:hypothetical protein [bacterium]
MRVEQVNKTGFGLRKLVSFQDLAKQRGVNITPMKSNSHKEYLEYMRKVVINVKKNATRAIESAKKIFIK